ncbi:MAG TPA: response regulator [Polyangiaceae bacterium]
MNESPRDERGRRILLADDNEALQRTVKQIAERRGHLLVQALTGAETMKLAIEAQPEVIVLDIDFPDADGRDMLSKLKADPRTANIPVVVWSGRAGHPSDGRISLTLGAEDYVEKGDAKLLVLKLERILFRIDEAAQR